jgi:hypothetical protein
MARSRLGNDDWDAWRIIRLSMGGVIAWACLPRMIFSGWQEVLLMCERVGSP